MRPRQELAIALLAVALTLNGGCALRPATYPTGEYQPIHEAALAGDVVKISELLQGDPNSVNLRGWGGDTPLHLAVVHHHSAAVQLLLEKGAIVDARDDQDATPLHLAAQFGFVDVAEMLLAHDAKVNLRDSDQRTPLGRAELHHREAMVDWLRQHGGER
jgi:26S proteasome non-ATPase regulatory subunit 10